MITPQTVVDWISSHIHMLGWSGITALVSRILYLTFKGGSIAVDAKSRVLAAEANLSKMATNCVPTIQKNIEELNAKHDKTTELLENIDKNIAILVDRGRSQY